MPDVKVNASHMEINMWKRRYGEAFERALDMAIGRLIPYVSETYPSINVVFTSTSKGFAPNVREFTVSVVEPHIGANGECINGTIYFLGNT